MNQWVRLGVSLSCALGDTSYYYVVESGSIAIEEGYQLRFSHWVKRLL